MTFAMNRKTNLFYSTGQDSNFVTFSNYTEALTGNILSTNTKIFPSKFICLYIPELDTEEFETAKETFIKQYLIGYYENKLATLRDVLVQDNINTEDNIHPLDYLLKTIFIYDPDSRITFDGEICEQEYNGYFMDNICIIENNANVISKKINISDDIINIDNEKLHGWENSILPNEYIIDPIFDYEDGCHYNNEKSVTLENETTSEKSIKFNVLIPMFRIHSGYLNITNAQIKNSDEYEDTPMGMWFSDKVVELDRTSLSNYSYRPSWSICISSQFKPFPYGNYPNEILGYDDEEELDGSSYDHEHNSHNMPNIVNTFAMIMAKQSYLESKVDEIEKLNKTINDLKSRISALEEQ